ncbi:MAG: NAD(+) synthase, partial [Thermoplasmata archaeon]
VILGLSGGVDPALIANLCANSIGKKKVHALILPDKNSNKKDIEDAEKYAKELGISYEKKDISDILNEFTKTTFKIDNRVSIGNLKSRTRMVILYHYANCNNYLVVGTSNKTELLVGYFTKFGDGGSDMMPIGDLYKTQVWALSRN